MNPEKSEQERMMEIIKADNAPVRDGSELAKYETRRQQLARDILCAMISNPKIIKENGLFNTANIAESYSIADKMLAHERAEESEREKGGGK